MSAVSIAVAYHSGYGHTAQLATAVQTGAASVEGSEVHLLDVTALTDGQWALLDEADAIIFGSPTYMGTASGAFHVFAEASSKRWIRRAWQDKLAAGFTNSGSKSGDKLHTLQYFTILAAQHGMHWVNLDLPSGWNTSTSTEHENNRLGFYLGAGAATHIDQGIEAVHSADLSTATHLGRRVAEQALIYARGRAMTAQAA
ncbi:flavodoxin family protein [Streptomyces sp. NPDC023998]|uniref:flavodoxin family protein n=1 Tax=Streptomyces sp. NPDC023998 TaxID=3154597 RepID=UPI0033F6E5CC